MQDQNDLARELMQALGNIKKSTFHADKRFGVFQGELAVLHCIYYELKQEDETTPSSISKRLNVARPTVTAALNNLEKKGFITRAVSDNDKRSTQVSITSKGRQFLEDKHTVIQKHISKIIQGLGEENTKEFIRLLGLCLNIIRQEQPESELHHPLQQ